MYRYNQQCYTISSHPLVTSSGTLYIYLCIVNHAVEVLNLARQMGKDKVARKLGKSRRFSTIHSRFMRGLAKSA